LQLETENEDECEKGTVPPGKIEDECEKGTVRRARLKTSVKKAPCRRARLKTSVKKAPSGKISEPGKIVETGKKARRRESEAPPLSVAAKRCR